MDDFFYVLLFQDYSAILLTGIPLFETNFWYFDLDKILHHRDPKMDTGASSRVI